MNRFIYGFLLFSIAIFGQLSALDEPINEGLNTKSMYQRHLPSDIFEYVIKNDLVDLTHYETITEKQNLEGLDHLTIILGTHEGEKYVEITFWTENRNAEDNFGGIQVCYQNGKIIGYAVFDADGRDYLAPTPFSEEEEKKAATCILLLVEEGVAKIREES